MKERVMGCGVTFILLVCMLLFTYERYTVIEEEEVPVCEGMVLVEATENDAIVIPDKYNTGCTNELILEKVTGAGACDAVQLKENNGKLILDLFYGNKSVGNKVIISNKDFSDFEFVFQNNVNVTTEKTVTFVNCKFGSVSTERDSGKMQYIFENCDITHFFGSNSTFENCSFGGSNTDGLNPFRNVIVNNCYFSDLSHPSEKVLHSDGTQIYGYKDFDAENIHFYNCRMEIPDIPYIGNGTYVNACLMVQLEYSNGRDISFEDCHINGGGYLIYAWAKNTQYALEDVLFKDIYIGASKKWGNIYGTISSGVEFDNVVDQTGIYVASVWKDSSNKIHLSVSNDTNEEHRLIVWTENGLQEFVIPACPTPSQVTSNYTFADFPFDIEIVLDDVSEWVVCYEDEYEPENQIRYMNWGTQKVYYVLNNIQTEIEDEVIVDQVVSAPLLNSTMSTPVEEEQQEVLSGLCGKDLQFELADGVLTISGTGKMYNYSSSKTAPWFEVRESIERIVLEEGIVSVGEQAFRNCKNVEELVAPTSMEVVEKNAFIGCSALKELTLTNCVEEIKAYAFHSTCIETITYIGTSEEWQSTTIGSKNDVLGDATVVYVDPAIASGICGKDVNWTLMHDGTVYLNGTGSTYRYNSQNVSPLAEYKDSITSVYVGEGITELGEQLFARISNIESVTLSETVVAVNKNAFINCRNLETIYWPTSLNSVKEYAFRGSGSLDIYYAGTAEQWAQLGLLTGNDTVTEAKVYFNETY